MRDHNNLLIRKSAKFIAVYTDTNNGQDSSPNITAEQAEKHAYAVHLHNLITAQNFEWYGSCFYDFDDDIIKVGLTANITENQRQIIDLIGDSSIQFYNCEYSYQYLESVYKKLDSQQLLLYAVGVERYSISIEKIVSELRFPIKKIIWHSIL